MARPREFDEAAVLDAAIQCFWNCGFEATSVKNLTEQTGIATASLYNAYGDKRAIYRAALDHYVERSIGARIGCCQALPPRDAIASFFEDIVSRSVADGERKGCMLVNSALELAPHDEEFRQIVANALDRIEAFFRAAIERGQRDHSIATRTDPAVLARHFLGVLMGIRVLARVRPERALLDGVIAPALAALDQTCPPERPMRAINRRSTAEKAS